MTIDEGNLKQQIYDLCIYTLKAIEKIANRFIYYKWGIKDTDTQAIHVIYIYK